MIGPERRRDRSSLTQRGLRVVHLHIADTKGVDGEGFWIVLARLESAGL